MSKIVTNDKNLSNQRINNLDNNRVFLSFDVNKSKTGKLATLLGKTKMFLSTDEKEVIVNSMLYNNINIGAIRALPAPSKMTLARTYVVTMAKKFSMIAETFYGNLKVPKMPEAPVFDISNETNLMTELNEQTITNTVAGEALEEATRDLSGIMENLNQNKLATPQVLANNPLGDTIIENPVNLNGEQPLSQQTPVINPVESEQPVIGKVKTRKLRGNVLAVPVIIIWLGLVLVGTIKAVTAILT